MKVGIIMPLADKLGGAEIMLLHLLLANKESAAVEYTLVFFEDGPLVKESEDLGYRVRVVHTGKLRQPGRYASAVGSLYGWIKRERLDAVLSWMSKAHLYAGPAAALARVPALWYQHGIPAAGKMERCLALLPAKAVLVPSGAALEAQKKLSPQLPVRVVHPSVDLKAYDPSALPPAAEVRRKLGIPEGRTVIGIVARLQRWKGVHNFVEAAAAVRKEHPEAYFVVVGGPHRSEPDYPAELERLAAEHGMTEEHLRFAGHQANPAEWMQSFDIFVHASLQEPFGMVIIEGLALGKAVIATAKGGPLEILTSGENGLLVRPDDPAELAGAMRSLIRKPELYRKVSAAGLMRAQAFGAGRLAAEVAGLLQAHVLRGSGETHIEYKHS